LSQITRNTPRRRMILHFLQIGFTDARTFTFFRSSWATPFAPR